MVPKSCRETVICHVHDATHSGVLRTYEDLRVLVLDVPLRRLCLEKGEEEKSTLSSLVRLL